MSDQNIFSYTKRDYAGARKEGLAKIPIISDGAWTDLNITDPGIIILDYVHSLVDMINYYQDHQALETFLTTAKERANIFRVAKQLSYRINSAKSARVNVTFHSDFIYDHMVKIPKYTNLKTKDSINYITTEDAYMKAGEFEIDIPCKQGKMYTKTYHGTGYSRFSNVEPPMNVNQTVTLTTGNIDIDSITIIDNLDRVWRPVDFIVFSTELDRVFQADLNPDDSVTIRFGDGYRGIIPGESDVLTISYLVTDAEDGRVGEGGIISADSVYDSGKYIDFKVTNKEASVGGSSAQSSASIKELAPGAIKAQGRAVTLSDFANLARLVDGVADAKAYDINTNPNIPYHEVRVLVIPNESSSKDILVKDVYDYLYQRMIPPTNLHVTTPSAITIDINVVVAKMGDITESALEYQITQKVQEYFKSISSLVGEDFYPTDLSAKIANMENVKYVVSMTPTNIVEVPELSVAELGTLTVTVQ